MSHNADAPTPLWTARKSVVFGGEAHTGWLPPGAAQPLPVPTRTVDLKLRIRADGSQGFLLEWDGGAIEDCGDTWHAKLEEAFALAEVCFGVLRDEWSVASRKTK